MEKVEDIPESYIPGIWFTIWRGDSSELIMLKRNVVFYLSFIYFNFELNCIDKRNPVGFQITSLILLNFTHGWNSPFHCEGHKQHETLLEEGTFSFHELAHQLFFKKIHNE